MAGRPSPASAMLPAAPADASETVRLPITLVHALPKSEHLLVSSPQAMRIVSPKTGHVGLKLPYEAPSAAPRNAAAVFLEEASSSSSSTTARYLLALVGDNKMLTVLRLTIEDANGTIRHDCILRQMLPKRVVKLVWEDEDETDVKRLIIGDRHGDVRSIVVSAAVLHAEAESSLAARETDGKALPNSEDDEDDNDPGTLHVGHVSLLTDFVLSSFSSNTATKPDTYIITSDRDEHIRMSRWGKRRAGFLALRYLLGSTDAVGSLCTIEGQHLDTLRASLSSKTSIKGQEWTAHPLLLSADGARLRLWSLYPDSLAGQIPDCLAVFDLSSMLRKHVNIDPWRERRRDKIFGKGKIDMKRSAENLPSLDDARDRTAPCLPIITGLRILPTRNGLILSFCIDGGRAIFTVPLEALFESQDTLSRAITFLDVGLPIIDVALIRDSASGLWQAWLACDIRTESVDNASEERASLQCAQWSDATAAFVLSDSRAIHPLRPLDLEDRGAAAMAASILVYDALMLYPKQDFEATASLESSSADGLIKGGLANNEIPGKPASKANHSNSEHVTRRREKAREAMMKRIEEHVVESDQPKPMKRRHKERKINP